MGSRDPERRSDGPRGESGENDDGQTVTVADAGDRSCVGRRRFVQGALATGVALPGVAAASGAANVDVSFRDCVTVEVTGDVGEVTGLHFHVWNSVDVVDDHLLVEDVTSLTPGETLPNGLRVTQYDPDEGVFAISLNTTAYNYLDAADVYLGGDPDFFGDGADVSEQNRTTAHVALTDVSQDDGAYGDGDVVTAETTLVNLADQQRTVFMGYSAVGPDGLAYTNGGTTGTTVTLGPGETRHPTLDWEVQPEAPDGSYDAHVAVWRESDPDALETRYGEYYLDGAFAVGETVDASVEGVSLPGGTYADGETVATDVTVQNTGTAEHSFYVGYSAVGPDDVAYTNGGTTGAPMTLAAGETNTVTVDWTVQPEAPAGAYDVHVALWAESDPGALETNLDEEIHDATFEVG